uniref:Uncharacterized protein n=1 Tax=viral metagenome TaxID=1070528 RepID=A0A6C0KWL3_9ZZZZ
MSSLDLDYHSMDKVKPILNKDEYREDDVSSVETDSLDELSAIRQKIDQILKEITEIKNSIKRMESSWCSIL